MIDHLLTQAAQCPGLSSQHSQKSAEGLITEVEVERRAMIAQEDVNEQHTHSTRNVRHALTAGTAREAFRQLM